MKFLVKIDLFYYCLYDFCMYQKTFSYRCLLSWFLVLVTANIFIILIIIYHFFKMLSWVSLSPIPHLNLLQQYHFIQNLPKLSWNHSCKQFHHIILWSKYTSAGNCIWHNVHWGRNGFLLREDLFVKNFGIINF